MNDVNNEEKKLREKIVKEPNDINAWIDLGYILSEKGNYEEAERAFKKVLDISTSNIFALYALGYLYYTTKKLSDA